MTDRTYKREKIYDILCEAADDVLSKEDAVNILVERFGLTVEDPKPEPGVYLNTQGRMIVVSPEGVQVSIDPGNGRNGVLRELSTYSADELIPARVVPAEPVELTEEQVGELWGNWLGDFAELNGGYHPEASKHITATVNAALAKYGHGAP